MVVICLIEVVYSDIIYLDRLMYKIFWSSNTASTYLMKRINHLTRTFKILLSFGFMGIGLVCVGAAFFQLHPDWPIVNKNDPFQYAAFLTAFSVQCLAGCLIVFIYASMFFYACIHVYVQMTILTEYLGWLSEDVTMKVKQHNRYVKDRMVFVIKQHRKLSRLVL